MNKGIVALLLLGSIVAAVTAADHAAGSLRKVMKARVGAHSHGHASARARTRGVPEALVNNMASLSKHLKIGLSFSEKPKVIEAQRKISECIFLGLMNDRIRQHIVSNHFMTHQSDILEAGQVTALQEHLLSADFLTPDASQVFVDHKFKKLYTECLLREPTEADVENTGICSLKNLAYAGVSQQGIWCGGVQCWHIRTADKGKIRAVEFPLEDRDLSCSSSVECKTKVPAACDPAKSFFPVCNVAKRQCVCAVKLPNEEAEDTYCTSTILQDEYPPKAAGDTGAEKKLELMATNVAELVKHTDNVFAKKTPKPTYSSKPSLLAAQKKISECIMLALLSPKTRQHYVANHFLRVQKDAYEPGEVVSTAQILLGSSPADDLAPNPKTAFTETHLNMFYYFCLTKEPTEADVSESNPLGKCSLKKYAGINSLAGSTCGGVNCWHVKRGGKRIRAVEYQVDQDNLSCRTSSDCSNKIPACQPEKSFFPVCKKSTGKCVCAVKIPDEEAENALCTSSISVDE